MEHRSIQLIDNRRNIEKSYDFSKEFQKNSDIQSDEKQGRVLDKLYETLLIAQQDWKEIKDKDLPYSFEKISQKASLLNEIKQDEKKPNAFDRLYNEAEFRQKMESLKELERTSNNLMNFKTQSKQVKQNYKFDGSLNNQEDDIKTNRNRINRFNKTHYQFDESSNKKYKPQQERSTSSLQRQCQEIHSQLYRGEITQSQAKRDLSILQKQVNKECTFQPKIGKSPSNQSIDIRRQNSVTEMSIHDRLYLSGLVHKISKEKYSDIKMNMELKNCSFKPQISQTVFDQGKSQGRNSLQRSTVFDRLYQTHLIGKQDFSDLREKAEIKGCTFQPERSSDQRLSVNEDFNGQLSTFDRLYKEADSRQKVQKINEVVKEKSELKDCTFKPKIISQNNISSFQTHQSKESDQIQWESGNKYHKAEIYDRLNKQNEQKQRELSQKRLEKERRELQECSFKPKINSSSFISNDENSLPAHERLYRYKNSQSSIQRFDKTTSQSHMNKSPIKDISNRQEGNLLQRMKEFAEKKKRKVALIANQMNKDQGITFKPQINKKTSRSRSAPRIPVRLQTNSRHDPKQQQTSKLQTYFDTIQKNAYENSEYCETAFFQQALVQDQKNITPVKPAKMSDVLYSLEQKLIEGLDTNGKEKYRHLQMRS